MRAHPAIAALALLLGRGPFAIAGPASGECPAAAPQSVSRLIEVVDGATPHRLQARAGVAPTGGLPHLTYRGGRVLDRPSVSLLFLGAYWNGAGAGERDHLTRFARAWAGLPVQGVLAQYGAGPARFAGARVQEEAVWPRRVGKRRLQELVLAEASRVGYDPQRIYTVILPPGVVLGDGTGTTSLDKMAGFHGGVEVGRLLDPLGRPVLYAAIAYSGVMGRNGINFNGIPVDAITITLSHEWAEAVTNPDGETGQLAWYDDRLGEIGDLALAQLPLPNTWVRVGPFAIQRLWSNRDGRYEVAPAGG